MFRQTHSSEAGEVDCIEARTMSLGLSDVVDLSPITLGGIMNAPNEADIVCERVLPNYLTGLGNWTVGALSFAEHFYEQQIVVTNGAVEWKTALALVRAE